jgi:Fe-S-cluster-containing dehydrogenase component
MIEPGLELFIDPSRCIGCQACFHACAECETHRGTSMIHLDYVDRAESVQTVPTVCMHCEEPACASACPADAIKKTADGIVQSALQSRCIGCSNCVIACPFGIPKMKVKQEQMMKCDMCYDRTSIGLKPMCATVCPSQALTFATPEEVAHTRREQPTNVFQFGDQRVVTKVFMMVPEGVDVVSIDVADYIWEPQPWR